MVKWSTIYLIFHLLSFLVLPIWARNSQFNGEELRQREADRVTDLPGQPPVNFRHYAGYVQLLPDGHKALFYWFFEAQNGAARKPLVLWLNGGPGCSSVGYGAAQELGSFLIRSNGTQLVLNKFSWNKAANMLFLESPVGVGFSYTNNSKDLYDLGDQVASEDAYAFLVNWFKRFPEFKSHEFYIAGESYAGHYVPQLASLIYYRNKESTKDSYINLKGFMIGNAVINDETDAAGFVDYAWTHAIISDQLYNSIKRECGFEQGTQTSHCNADFRGVMRAYNEIDIYNIYAPVCPDSLPKSAPKLVVAPHFLTQHELWHRLPAGYDPCADDYVEKYFNREDVQKALHANVTNLRYPYTLCRFVFSKGSYPKVQEYCKLNDVDFINVGVIRRWNDSPDSMLPIIQKLLNAGLRIWIYSGDIDGRVPVTSTRYGINKMGLKVNEEWRAWFHKNQVAGWVETYEGGFTFATVRGAGHTVPVFAPHQALSLFAHFLSAKALPRASPF